MKLNEMNLAGQPARGALPPQAISEEVLLEKYAKNDERTVDEVRRRVARALAAVERPESARRGRSPSTARRRTGSFSAGASIPPPGPSSRPRLINCFVQPVGDSISSDGDEVGIYAALNEAAETMRRGGGVGYDFSRIRPQGAHVRGTNSRASGPLSYMRVFDQSCETVESAGARRGAQMGVLRCDHPDVEAFIHAKDQGNLRNFNLSVAATDAFMQAVMADGEWELVHRAPPSAELIAAGAYRREDGLWVYRKVRAAELWQQIMASTYDHAEPGVVFIDTINRDNNLSYCEVIEATNPCGEEPLPAYGCCDLGSIDLTRFVQAPFTAGGAVRFRRPARGGGGRGADAGQRARRNGVAAAAAGRGSRRQAAHRPGLHRPGRCAADAQRFATTRRRAERMAAAIARELRDAAYLASVELAKEKGPFPLFEAEQYLAAPRFASRLPERSRRRSGEHGMRNSHLLAIAPTGTISLAFADNASNGIEPAFSWFYTRKKRMADDTRQEYHVEDHAYRVFKHLHGIDDDVTVLPFDAARALPPGAIWAEPDGKRYAMLPAYFVTALEMTAQDHLRMSAAVQPFVDTAISKTVNVPADYPFAEFKDLYLEAWKSGLKGLTTYRPNAVVGSVLEVQPQAAAPLDFDVTRSGSPHPARAGAPTAAREPALAGTSGAAPTAIRAGRTRCAIRWAISRCSSATSRTGPRIRSRCGSTAPSSRVAWVRSPRRCRWTCARRTGSGSR